VSDIILSIIYVVSYTNSPAIKNPIHPCDRYIERLSLDTKIKISMGCSRVKGKYLYSYKYLNDLAEGKYE
jgi:hypothetical protein